MSVSKRGFASMTSQKKRQVASKGGLAAQMSGHAHRLTNQERSRGGANSPRNFKYRPSAEVREIGRRGGRARHATGERKMERVAA